LKNGARVALVAPAGPVAPERLQASIERCRALGLESVLLPAAAERHRFLAGTDERRLADLQAAFDDPAIDAVWALRGGYGTVRVLAKLDLARQRKAPIPFIGFSDNTTIHARHAALGVVSFHGPHPGAEFPPETEKSFVRTLFEAAPAGPLEARPGDPSPRSLTGGVAEATLVGGNLSLLASLCGTPDALPARDCILFLEDTGEPAYRVDRMLHQLQRAGMTDGVRGLAFGRFSDAPDEEEHPVEDALREFAERLRVPAVCDLPFGHVEHNCTLPIGVRARLSGDEAMLEILEPAVSEVR
jgi:muramoyltetrapeptide carboxypeptidase